ncbi:hypothetical protein H7Y29_01865 [Microbacteriaceae bacterium]|nr:hypothetical protein [Candidatus Saccharibacteria bacterium]
MNATFNRVSAIVLGASVVASSLVGTAGTAYATNQSTKGQSTTHLVYCQQTGNHWTITKGDNPSDNKNRTQVGTWDEHERGEGWNQKKATTEFLDKCGPIESETPSSPAPTTPAPSTKPDKADDKSLKGDKGQSTTHFVFCQKTGNHWTITKGNNPSDNKNRVQIGTWNEHERGEGWNQKKAEAEFLSKCTPATTDAPVASVVPGKGSTNVPAVHVAAKPLTGPTVSELPHTGSLILRSVLVAAAAAAAAYGMVYLAQTKKFFN